MLTVWAAVAVSLPGQHDLDRLAKAAVAAGGTAVLALLLARFRQSLPVLGRSPALRLLLAFSLLTLLLPLFVVRDGLGHGLSWLTFAVGPLFGAGVALLGRRAGQVLRRAAFAAVPCAVFAIGQQLMGHGPAEIRATTSMANPNQTAAITLFGAVVLAALASQGGAPGRWLAAGATLAFLGTVATASKAGIVAVISGVALLPMAHLLAQLAFRRWLAFFLALALLPPFLAVIAGAGNPIVQKAGLEGRFLLWAGALEQPVASWWSGSGFGLWQPSLVETAAARIRETGAEPLLQLPQYLYNDVLQLACEAGLVPAGLLVAVLALLATAGLRSREPPARAAALALPALFLFGLAQSPMANPAASLLLWTCLGTIAGVRGEELAGATRGTVSRLGLIALLLGACLLGLQAVRLASGMAMILQSRGGLPRPEGSSSADRALLAARLLPEYASAWLSAADLLEMARRFAEAKGCLQRALSLERSFPALFRQGYLVERLEGDAAARAFWQSLAETYPWLLTPHYRLALLDRRRGYPGEALEHCRQALALPALSPEQTRVRETCQRLADQLGAQLKAVAGRQPPPPDSP
ncbi:MAG: tetratricopeptide repeat protein [Thermodesulfobacteriota bacterium]